jgi:hypothetical protein
MQETSASANLAMPAHTVLENCATETQRYKVYLTNNFPGSPFAVWKMVERKRARLNRVCREGHRDGSDSIKDWAGCDDAPIGLFKVRRLIRLGFIEVAPRQLILGIANIQQLANFTAWFANEGLPREPRDLHFIRTL